MNDRDATKVADALRGLADAGREPDLDAAWGAITQEVAAAERRTRVTRRIMAAGIAVASAAAVATLVLLGSLDRDEAIEVGPVGPGPTTSVPAEPSNTSTTVGTAALPEATLLVASGDGSELRVVDAMTGRVVGTPVTVPGGQIFDAAITADGTIFYRAADAYGTPTEVRRTTWDGGASTTVDAIPAGSSGLALDPTETLLAFSLSASDGDTSTSRIGFYDLTNGEVSYQVWAADEAPDRRTGGIGPLVFSPDGSQLAFSASQDSFDPIESFVIDVAADSLSDARSLGVQVSVAGWTADGGMLGRRNVALGEPSPLQYLEGGPDVGLPSVPGQVDAVVTGRSGLTIRVLDGSELRLLRLDPAADQWVDLGASAGQLLAASP
jgi:hypothetical protein